MSTKTPKTKDPTSFAHVFAEMSQALGYDIGTIASNLEQLLRIAPHVLMGGDVSASDLSHYQKWNANFANAFEKAGLPWEVVIDAIVDLRGKEMDWTKVVLPAPPVPYSVRMVQMIGLNARGERVVYGNNAVAPEGVLATNLEEAYVNWVASKQRTLMKHQIFEVELQIWNDDHPITSWGLRFEPRLVITNVRPPVAANQVDLLDREQALTYLQAATSQADWDARVFEVRSANGEEYPNWWMDDVLVSGLSARMADRWKK